MCLTKRHDCLVFNSILTVTDVVAVILMVVVVPQGNMFIDIYDYSSMGLFRGGV